MDLVSHIPGVGPSAPFNPGVNTPAPHNVPHQGLTDGTGPGSASKNVAEIYNRDLLWRRALIAAAGLSFDPTNWVQEVQALSALITLGVAGASVGAIKSAVRFTTTANITLSGLGTQAGGDWAAPMTAGDRVLVKDQTTGSQNGYYAAAAGAWVRTTDADGVGELTPGVACFVTEGATLADSFWELATDGVITIGSTSLTFVRKDPTSGGKQWPNCTVGVAGGAMTITLDPCTTEFRSATLTSGQSTPITNSAALSLTIPSGGSLGIPAGQLGVIAVVEINNGGVKELAVANIMGVPLDEMGVISTTAIGAGSTANNVFYSATARSSVPYRVRTLIYSNQVSSGVYAANPTLVQPVAGQAGSAFASIGYGQSWQNVTGSRALGTTYYNTTGKPIYIAVMSANGSVGNRNIAVTINGVGVTFGGGYVPGADSIGGTILIPAGASYNVTVTNGSLQSWAELR